MISDFNYTELFDKTKKDTPHCPSCLNVTRMEDMEHIYIPTLSCDKYCPSRRNLILDKTVRQLLKEGHNIVVDQDPITLSL